MLKEMTQYLFDLAATPWGPVALVVHAYLEAFILPVGHELILIPVALANPRWSLVFALMSTTASTFGIMTGYAVGKWGGRPLLKRVINPELLALTEREIHRYDVWAIAIACFTPFPDKVFAPVAGAIHLNFKKVVVVAFLSRGARFFLVCGLLFFYGESMKQWILDYAYYVLAGILGIFLLSYLCWKLMVKFLLKKEHLV